MERAEIPQKEYEGCKKTTRYKSDNVKLGAVELKLLDIITEMVLYTSQSSTSGGRTLAEQTDRHHSFY